MSSQTFTPSQFAVLPSKDALLKEFVGKHIDELRTPAMVIDRTVFGQNCANMHARAQQWGAKFRAHVKSHKTAEGTRLQLISSADRTYAVVASTLMEAWQIVHAGLFQDGTVNDLLYGLPFGANKLADLSTLAEAVRPHGGEIRILIDHPDQVKILEQFETTQIHPRKWSVYILLDGATKRAGVEQGSDAFNELLSLVFESPHITLYGFYVHASIAYGSTSMDDATSFLSGEVLAVNTAARLALDFLAAAGKSAPGQPFILSVGSTPTAHAMSSEETRVKLANILHGTLELHAGNYPLLDLQQEHTKLISQPQISQRIRVTVLSVYPGRGEKGEDEGLVDGGAIAFSKDTGPSGIFGKVVGRNWELTRISQEHGTITHVVGTPKDTLKLGEVVEVIGQHACLIAAAHLWYYVVDKNVEDGKRVVDVWVAWKGW